MPDFSRVWITLLHLLKVHYGVYKTEVIHVIIWSASYEVLGII